MRKVNVIIETAPHNFAAYIDGVDGLGVTGETIAVIKTRIRSGIDYQVRSCTEEHCEVPEQLQGEYELVFHLDVKTFLEVYAGILSKAGIERLSGINQKQLWHYANGTSAPRKKQVQKIQDAVHKLGEELCAVEFI